MAPQTIANSPEIDSLREVLLHQKGEAKAHSLYRLGELLSKDNFDQSLSQLQAALSLAMQYNDKDLTAYCYKTLSEVQSKRGKYKEALPQARKALTYFKGIQDTARMEQLYNTLGNCYNQLGLYDRALEHYLLMLNLIQADKVVDMGRAYNNIANLYTSLHEKEKALAYSKRSLDIFRELNDTTRIIYVMNNMTGIFDAPDQSREAIDTLLKALKLAENADDPTLLTMVSFNLAYHHGHLKEVEPAKKYMNQCNAYFKQSSFRTIPPPYLLEEANIYKLENQLDSALLILKQTVQITADQQSLQYRMISYSQIADIYKQIDRTDSALHYMELYSTLRDSLYSAEKENLQAGAKIDLELKEKEDELMLIRANEAEALRKDRRNSMILNILLGIGLLGLIIYVAFLRKKTKT